MINMATTLIYSLQTNYTIHRFRRNEVLEEMLLEEIRWELFYLISTVLVIYFSNQVTKEVINRLNSNHI